jgi:uncharacterized membrane protein
MIGLNSILALIPVLFGWLMIKTKHQFLQVAWALIWFSFLPNTLYILTDLRYLPSQWNDVTNVSKPGLAVQYGMYELLGVSSFLLALYPLEKYLLHSRWRENLWIPALLLIVLNFFIGFGIVLGRVQRLNRQSSSSG